MKKLTSELTVGIIVDLVCNGILYFVFHKQGYFEFNLELVFIVSTIICIAGTVAILILNDKLRKYSHANHVQLFTYLTIIQKLFQTNPEIVKEYKRDIQGMKRLNPLKKETIDHLFIFEKDCNYRQLIEEMINKQMNLSLFPNEDNPLPGKDLMGQNLS